MNFPPHSLFLYCVIVIVLRHLSLQLPVLTTTVPQYLAVMVTLADQFFFLFLFFWFYMLLGTSKSLLVHE